MGEVPSVTAHFRDELGRAIASIKVFSAEVSENLYGDADRDEWKPEISLLEGKVYEYIVEGLPDDVIVAENTVVRPSVIDRFRGRLEPGEYTGYLPIHLRKREGLNVARCLVEVRSKKIDYSLDYRTMLEEIATKATDLLLEMRSPSQVRIVPDPGRDAQTIYQRFAFLKSLIGSREFKDAISQIVNYPHISLDKVEEYKLINRGFRPNAKVLRDLVAGHPRIPIPGSHYLHEQFAKRGVSEPSLPARILVEVPCDNLDTAENRFVKYVLTLFADFLASMGRRIQTLGLEKDESLLQDIHFLEDEIALILERDFFAGIGELRTLPLHSPVLQKRGGYREVLQAWLKFQLSAQLVWNGGIDVYGAGQRDVAALYEYWLFFKLLDLFSSVFEMDAPAVSSLIEGTEDGFGLKLKSGKALILSGTYLYETRRMRVQFAYNRTFGGHRTDVVSYPAGGSWTRRMRPDYTISVWPAAFSENAAERQELIVHIHFDAKYRADTLVQLFGGDTPEELDEEKAAARTFKVSKREDLLKMHAYKDAIRRTEGAYILYPGTEKLSWRGFHELLPGLGAFPVRPSEADKDMMEIRKFVLDVMQHLANRATQLEAERFHKNRIYEKEYASKVYSNFPGLISGTNKTQLVTETFVLCGTRSDRVIDWMIANHKFVFKLGVVDGIPRLMNDFQKVQYIALSYTHGTSRVALLRCVSRDLEFFTGHQLNAKAYPEAVEEGCLYVSISIEPAELTLDEEKTVHNNLNRFSTSEPIIVPLARVLDLRSI